MNEVGVDEMGCIGLRNLRYIENIPITGSLFTLIIRFILVADLYNI